MRKRVLYLCSSLETIQKPFHSQVIYIVLNGENYNNYYITLESATNTKKRIYNINLVTELDIMDDTFPDDFFDIIIEEHCPRKTDDIGVFDDYGVAKLIEQKSILSDDLLAIIYKKLNPDGFFIVQSSEIIEKHFPDFLQYTIYVGNQRYDVHHSEFLNFIENNTNLYLDNIITTMQEDDGDFEIEFLIFGKK